MSAQGSDQALRKAIQKTQREERAKNRETKGGINRYIPFCFSPPKLPPSLEDTAEIESTLGTLGDPEVETILHDSFNITKGKELNPPSSPQVLPKLVQSLREHVSSEKQSLPVLGESSQLPFTYTLSTNYIFSQPRTLDLAQTPGNNKSTEDWAYQSPSMQDKIANFLHPKKEIAEETFSNSNLREGVEPTPHLEISTGQISLQMHQEVVNPYIRENIIESNELESLDESLDDLSKDF